jgi:hypothetical protein
MQVPPLPRSPARSRRFFDAYTQGQSTAEVGQLFTRDAPEAYRFFSRTIDFAELRKLPWHRRTIAHIRLFFLAFTLKLTPARRALYGLARVATFVGLMDVAVFARGTLWLIAAFGLLNLIVLLEVADRLSLKNDLEIAREKNR